MYTPTSLSSPNYSSLKGTRLSRNITMETAAESPIQVRTKSVEKRFNKIQAEAQEAKARGDQMEARIRLVDETITKDYKESENKLKIFTKHIERLEENVAAEIIARELLEERSLKELTVVESSIALELQNEKEKNKESQRAMSSQMEGNMRKLKEEFTREQTRINTFKEEQFQLISAYMSELQQGLEKEQSSREIAHETIIKTMNNNVHKMHEALAIERKVRVETEGFLYTKIGEISASLKRQVSSEREKQERDEAHLLTLLEEVCNRFEEQFASYQRR